MLRFWRNPELVRHFRAELRPARALTAAVLVLVVCALVALACWGTEPNASREFFRLFYGWLTGMQYVFLGFWCASACGQAISRERELKTYDFLKTTRLTAAELTVGKILGAPLMAYYAVACSLPISLLAGNLAGYSLRTLFWTCVLMVVFALFVGLMALWGSMQVERSSAGAVGLLALFPISFAFGFSETPFPGFGAISIFPAIFSLFDPTARFGRVTPTFFGLPVSNVVLTLLLYAAFGAWFVLMLTRNLKKDLEEIRLLSRWQAVGFAAFLNVLFYAFLDPKRVGTEPAYDRVRPDEVATVAVGLNWLILLAIGIATLTPHEKLKVWWRKRTTGAEPYLSSDGLPWPWLVATALIAYAMLAAEAWGLRSSLALEQWQLGSAALQLFGFLVFTTRDILFLQWCSLTRMKRPVVKGLLYLGLYYTAAGIITAVVSIGSSSQSRFLLGLLTPFGLLDAGGIGLGNSPGFYLGVALQLGVIVLLLNAISRRLARPAIAPAPAAA